VVYLAYLFKESILQQKFAINGITQALSLETENFGIKTITINPGDTKTNVIKNKNLSKKIKKIG